MPPAKKRKFDTDLEVVPQVEGRATTSEAPSMSNDANSESATGEPNPEDKSQTDGAAAVDKNAERKARFKALQARAVGLRNSSQSSRHVLTYRPEKLRTAQPQGSSRRSPETIHRPQSPFFTKPQTSNRIS